MILYINSYGLFEVGQHCVDERTNRIVLNNNLARTNNNHMKRKVKMCIVTVKTLNQRAKHSCCATIKSQRRRREAEI